MPRAASPFYYQNDANLGATLGQSLGRALFGDPEAAAQLALRKAQMENYAASAEEARAHAGLYGEQTTGLHTQDTAAASLPDMIRGFVSAPPPAPVSVGPVDPLAPLPSAPAGPSITMSGLGPLMAALAQAQGDKVDPNKVIAGLTALAGTDEQARRGLVAQGSTPGKEFALTPDRADAIAQQGYTADYNKGTAEARINHASDLPIANIQSSTTRRGQDIEHGDRTRGQDLEHGDRVYDINVKAGADIENPAGANVIARALGSGAVITDNARTRGQADAIYAQQHPGVTPPANSNHYAAQGFTAFDVRPVPGMTFEEAKRRVSEQAIAMGGYLDPDTRDEGTHWHMVVKGVKKGAITRQAQAPKPISTATSKELSDEVDKQLAARGLTGQPDAGTMVNIRNGAMYRYQKSGNPVDAVSATLDQLQRKAAAKKGGGTQQAASSPKKLRDDAMAAIQQGADPAAVKARFKKMTGQELVGA